MPTGEQVGRGLGEFGLGIAAILKGLKARKERKKREALQPEIDALESTQLFNAIREAGRQKRIGEAEAGLEAAIKTPLDIQPEQLQTGYLSDIYNRALGVQQRGRKAALDELALARGDISYFQKQFAPPSETELQKQQEAKNRERLAKDLEIINDPEIPDVQKRAVLGRMLGYTGEGVIGRIKMVYPHLFPKEDKEEAKSRIEKRRAELEALGYSPEEIDEEIRLTFGRKAERKKGITREETDKKRQELIEADLKSVARQYGGRTYIPPDKQQEIEERYSATNLSDEQVAEMIRQGAEPVGGPQFTRKPTGASPVAGGGGAVGPVPSAPSKTEEEARGFIAALKQGAKPSELWPDYPTARKYWLDRKAEGTIDQAVYDFIHKTYLSPGYPRK